MMDKRPDVRHVPMRWALGLAALGLALSGVAAWKQGDDNQARIQQRLTSMATGEVNAIANQLDLVEHGLRGARGYVMGAGLDNISRRGFRSYILSRDMAQAFQGVHGFGLIRRFAPAYETAFLTQAISHGWPQLTIRQLTPHNGERGVIQFVEPIETNKAAIGLDTASETQRVAAIRDALRTSRATLTGPIRLVQSNGKASLGLLFMLPVTDPGEQPYETYGVKGAPALVYAALQLNELLAAAGSHPDLLALNLRDITQPGLPLALYHSPGSQDTVRGSLPLFLTRALYGRNWSFELTARPALVQELHLLPPLAVFGIGLLLTALLSLLTFVWQTSRMRARVELRERTRLSMMLDTAGEAAVETNPLGNVVLWNRAAEHMFGYTREQAVGRPANELIMPDPGHLRENDTSTQQALRGQATPGFETLLIHRDGNMIPAEITVVPVYDANQKVVGVGRIIRNIAERHAAAQEQKALTAELSQLVAERTELLRRASHDLRTVLDALPSMIGSWDKHLLNRFANKAYAAWFGKDPKEIESCHIRELLGEALYEKNRPYIDAVLRGEVQTFERDIPTPDGKGTRHSLAHYVPDFDHGEIVGFFVLVHDITPVKEAQRALAGSEGLLRRVGQLAQVGGWRLDLISDDLYWTEQTRVIHGVGDDDHPSLEQALSFFPAESRATLSQAIETARSGMGGWDLELPLVQANGAQIWVRSMGEVETEAGRAVRIVGAIQDITAQRLADEKLRQATTQAQDANKAKGEFLANMSHEIRTPLNAIIGLGYMLEQHQLAPAERAMVAKIQTAGRTLMSVINDVLDLSKIEAGQITIHETPYNLPEVLNSEMQMLAPGATTKGLSLTMHVDDDVPSMLLGDEIRLTQILTNLIGNAVKFTEHGSVHVHVVRVTDGMRDLLRFTVKDTGPGIAAEAQARLFQPFTQADASTTRKFGGTGLGLSIVAKLVTLMGGRIALRSQEGHGSEFTVELPLRLPGEDQAESDLSALRVAVADDDIDQLNHLRALATSLGWQTQTADSGQKLVQLTLEAVRIGKPFDALIVDWLMPGMDGLSAVAEIHQHLGDAEVPAIVVVSAQDVVRLRSDPQAARGASILQKPVNVSTLFNAVNSAVATKTHAHERMLQGSHIGNDDSIWLSGIRLLVADDSALNLDVARHLLEYEGAIVTSCTDGAQVLALIKEDPAQFDAVLLDIQMPIMDGIEAARRIRQELELRALPLIALTADVLSQERERALANGMTDFLGKPIEPKRLIRTVRRHVERLRGETIPILPRSQPRRGEADLGMQIEGIDTRMVTSRLKSDPGLYRSMLKRFLAEFEDLSRLASPPENAMERTALAARLHKFRGSALVIGANAVATIAQQLEELLRNQTSPLSAIGPLQLLAMRLSELRDSAKPHLQGTEHLAPTNADHRPTSPVVSLNREAYDNLHACLERQSFNAISAFAALAPALSAQMPPEKFRALREAIEEFDFPRASELLRNLAG